MANYLKEFTVAKKAAKSAATVIQKYQREQNFSVDFKGKNDLVTEADIKTEQKILSVIKDSFPDDEILAEESTGKQQLSADRTWIIDPIDGTTNFAHGFPVYCVSIALWENKKPEMAVVLEVSSGELFTALKGKGAFLNGDPITVSGLQSYEQALVGTGFPYNDYSLAENYLRFFRMLMDSVQGLRRPGAATYDLCCVACGRFDGFYEYSLNAWDVGAAAFIVQEAGGTVTDWQGKDNWLMNKRIVAGNSAIHKYLFNNIAEYFTDEERSG